MKIIKILGSLIIGFSVLTSAYAKQRNEPPCIDHLDDYMQRAPNVEYKELFVTGCNINDNDTEKLIAFLNLHQDIRYVALNGNPVGPKMLAALAAQPNLLRLGLQETGIDDEGAKILARNTTLNELDLQETNISAAGISYLVTNPALTRLYLTDNHIGDEGAKVLSQNQKLALLWLGNTGITDQGLTYFANHPGLRNLNIANNPGISARGISAIATIPHLTDIDMSDNAIGDDGIAALGNHLKLESIIANHCGIQGRGIEALKNPSLNTLILENNNLDDAATEAMAKIPTKKWDFVDLKKNNLGDAGAANLNKLNSVSHKTLSMLILSQNHISDAGIIVITRSPKVKRLEVSRNNIHDEGAISLAKKRLDVLDITENHLSAKGIEVLKNSKAIKYAYVEKNDGRAN